MLNFHNKFNLIWTSMLIWKHTLLMRTIRSLSYIREDASTWKRNLGFLYFLFILYFYIHPSWNELPAPTYFLVRTVESVLHQFSTVHQLHLCWLATNKKTFESREAENFLVALSKKFAGLEQHRRCQLNQRGWGEGCDLTAGHKINWCCLLCESLAKWEKWDDCGPFKPIYKDWGRLKNLFCCFSCSEMANYDDGWLKYELAFKSLIILSWFPL